MNDAMSVPFLEIEESSSSIIRIFNRRKKKNKVEHDIDGLLKYLEYPLETTTLVFIAPYEKLDERKKSSKH